MSLTKQQIEHIALLARVRLADDEKDTLPGQLSSILDYVGQLQAVPTEGVAETAQSGELVNAWREDAVENCPPAVRQQILKNAPDTQDGLFKTKSVF